MKRILGLFLAVVTLSCFCVLGVPRAEAARVALVPLEQSENILVQNDKDFSILYWDVATEMFKFPAFDFISDSVMDKALPNGQLPDYKAETLKKIAMDTEADIVIAMRLDKMEDEEDYYRREPVTKMLVLGEYASWNRVTGKYMHDKIKFRDEVETPILVRTDWRVKAVEKLCKRYFYRTINN